MNNPHEETLASARWLREWLADTPVLPQHEEYLAGLDILKKRIMATDLQRCDSQVVRTADWELPNYEPICLLGEGGMGTVWLAQQTYPLKRRVAIKQVRPGQEHHAPRFLVESQAMAMLSHPNIAKIYEVGMTSQGQPYLVMEYIEGQPLDVYCDRLELNLNERLQLMAQICHTVHYLHQQGIIHRDIKPNNILVTRPDDAQLQAETFAANQRSDALSRDKSVICSNSIKLIDFGLAKNLPHSDHVPESPLTSERTILGSLLWMSPEQAQAAAMNSVSIDHRTDIFSLGAVLFHLITGTPPLEVDPSRPSSDWEILTAICRGEFEQPSVRYRRNRLGVLTGRRRRERISRWSEIDAIVTKTLQLNPEKRYRTAECLARDIENYLARRPLVAVKQSASQRLACWVRSRQRSLASFALLASILTVTATLWAYDSQRQFRRLDGKISQAQRLQLDREQQNRTLAEMERQVVQSRLESQRLDADLQILDKLFLEGLDRIAPLSREYRAENRDEPFLERMTRQVQQLPMTVERKLSHCYKIAAIWLSYDCPDRAAQILTTIQSEVFSTGRVSTEAFQCRCLWGECLIEQGNYEQGLQSYREAIEKYQSQKECDYQILWEQQTHFAGNLLQCGQTGEAQRVVAQALDQVELQNASPDKVTLNLKCIAAMAHCAQGDFGKATEICEQARQMKSDALPPDLVEIVCGTNLIDIYRHVGRYQDAAKLADQLLPLATHRFGDQHSRTLDLKKSSIINHYFAGNKSGSIEALQVVLAQSRRSLGDRHRLTINLIGDLSNLLMWQGRSGEAASLLQQTQADRLETYPLTHPEAIKSQRTLATALANLGEIDRAIETIKPLVEQGPVANMASGLQLLETVKLLSVMYLGQQQPQAAFDLMHRWTERLDNESAPGIQTIRIEAQIYLARMYFNVGQLITCQERCEDWLASNPECTSDVVWKWRLLLAELAVANNDFSSLQQQLELVRNSKSNPPTELVKRHFEVFEAESLMRKGQYQVAATRLQRVLREPQLSPIYQNYAFSLWGDCCRRLGQLDMARQYLERSYENLQQLSMPGTHAWYLPRVAQRLESLFEKLEDPVAAERWQQERLTQTQTLQTSKDAFSFSRDNGEK